MGEKLNGSTLCISTLQIGLCSIHDNNLSLLGKKNIATINELTKHEREITEGRAEAYQNVDEEETSITVVASSSRHRRSATPEQKKEPELFYHAIFTDLNKRNKS